jgi:hypothetical protein
VPTGIGITVTVLIMTTGAMLDDARRISGNTRAPLAPEVIDGVASHASTVTVRFRPEADAVSDKSRAIKAVHIDVRIVMWWKFENRKTNVMDQMSQVPDASITRKARRKNVHVKVELYLTS